MSLEPEIAAKIARLESLEREFEASLDREKTASLHRFAYGASHEINNPLANIVARAQSLLLEESHPEKKRQLGIIAAQAMRAHEMISDLMLYAKPPPLVKETFSPAELIRAIVQEAAAEAAALHVELIAECEGQEEIETEIDRTQVAVAIRALIRNALEASNSGGKVVVRLERNAESMMITVTDQGAGFTAETREKACDPFYSGREAGRGLGFGLSKCRRIIESHGGCLEFANTPCNGAQITIKLPLGAAHSSYKPNNS